MKNIVCLLKLLVAGCCFGQSQWVPIVERDYGLPGDQWFSTESFEKDKAMGLRILADPQSVRQVGARQFQVQHDLPADDKLYLRVAGNIAELQHEDFNRSLVYLSDLERGRLRDIRDRARDYSGLPLIGDPHLADANFTAHEYDSWDYIYQNLIDEHIVVVDDVVVDTEGGYFSTSSNLVRKYLLQERYHINAGIINPYSPDTGRIDSHNVSQFLVEADREIPGYAFAFLFDSDPFGFGHARPQNQRLAANLSGRSGRIYYQWIRFGGGEYSYGDIHECVLPRAAYIGVIGDSYTSGEGAPFREGSASAFGIGDWITSYVDDEHLAHRSYSSGWQKAVNQFVRKAFTTTSIDFNDVSRSGAQARWKSCADGFIDENRLSLSGTRVSGGLLRTGARQKLLLDDILERDSQQKIDILGFTFGGNDAYFSKLVAAIMTLDYDDGDYTLDNIGSIPDSDYPPFIDSPFPDCAPASFETMIEEAKPNVSHIRGNDHGFEIGFQLRGNYCNPVGRMYQYVPGAAPGSGTIANIDRFEMNLIRNDIMPMVNDDLVVDQLSSFSNSLVVDTRNPRGGSGLGHNHSHHMRSSDPWFNEVITIDGDDNRYNYAFHPNARGHDNIYRPAYYHELKLQLTPSRRSEIFEEESNDADLANLITTLDYRDDSTLGVEVAVSNEGGMASEPSLLNMRVEFGPRFRPEFWGGWIVGARSSAFETPLRDIDNNLITINSLAPGEVDWRFIELEKGELECVYYNLIINHFLQLSNTELIRETIDNYSPEQLHARFAAFLPLFGQDGVSISFNITPISGRERNMQNNRSRASELPFEVNLENMFGWAVKTKDEYYKELFDRIAVRGINLEKIGSYDMEDLFGDPSNLEKEFGVTTLAQEFFDRDAVEPELIFDASFFGEIYEVVDNSLDLGIIAPKPIFIDPYLFEDYLVVETPIGDKKIPFQRWYEVEDTLPKDGGVLKVRYCRAERNNDPAVPIKYTDIPIKVKTKHSYNGLEGFYENNVLNNGALALKVDFSERLRPANQVAFSRVIVRDTLSGGIFYDRYHLQGTEIDEIDLANLLFHSANVSVDISTDSNFASSTYKIKHGNESSVTQNNLFRSGAFVDFELIIRGAAAASFSNNLEIIIPNMSENQKELASYQVKLFVVSAEDAEEDNQKVKVVTVKMPLDLVYNETKIIKITDLDNSETSFLSSVDTRSLQDLLPLGGIAYADAIPVGVDYFNSSAILKEPTSGMIVVDKSDDMKNWSRVYSGMASGENERAVELQFNNPNKGFVRARQFILSEK